MQHLDGAMFPLANLRTYGLIEGGFASEHPNAMRVWLSAGGHMGIVALTKGGMLLPMLPDPGRLQGFVRALTGVMVTGAVGPARHVRDLLAAMGLASCPALLDKDEPGFALDLALLRLPVLGEARLIPATEDYRGQLVLWRDAYHREVLGTPIDQALVRSEADIASFIAKDSHRILMVAGVPVAMCGFNALLTEVVQVGGVYTPPILRGRGYARLAVGLHLEEALRQGVRRAVLFAASAAAARAYAALGFQPAPPVALVLFDGPQRVAA